MHKCRHCSIDIAPSEWQIKTRDYECAPCRKKRQIAYRAKRKASGNPVVSGRMYSDYFREYTKQYFANEENRKHRNELARSYNEKPHIRKHRLARSMVKNAILAGRLTRMPCEICGHLKSEGHHDDYDKPLEVRWLCKKHHVEVHKQKATGE